MWWVNSRVERDNCDLIIPAVCLLYVVVLICRLCLFWLPSFVFLSNRSVYYCVDCHISMPPFCVSGIWGICYFEPCVRSLLLTIVLVVQCVSKNQSRLFCCNSMYRLSSGKQVYCPTLLDYWQNTMIRLSNRIFPIRCCMLLCRQTHKTRWNYHSVTVNHMHQTGPRIGAHHPVVCCAHAERLLLQRRTPIFIYLSWAMAFSIPELNPIDYRI